MVQIKFLKLLVLYITNKFKNIFYSYLMENIKGGFPPINYDANETDTDTNTKKSTRERSFVSSINNNNINIREILKENDSIKPLIDINQVKEELEVIDTF